MTAALGSFARRVLGSYTDEGTHQPDGRRRVLHLTDSDGQSWYCKQTHFVVQWRAEVRAYRRWFAALDGEVPRLRAANRDKQLLLVSALPGEVVPEPAPAIHRAAGALLRRLHDAGPSRHEPSAKRRQMTARLDREIWRDGGDFNASEVAFIRERMQQFRDLPLLEWCAARRGPRAVPAGRLDGRSCPGDPRRIRRSRGRTLGRAPRTSVAVTVTTRAARAFDR